MSHPDLTELFLEAKKRSNYWIESGFPELVSFISAETEVTSIERDESVPEHWLTFEYKQGHTVSIFTDFPLALVDISSYDEISRLLRNWKLAFVVFENFEDQIFSIDSTKQFEIFPNSHSEIFEPEEFALSHLVFATMT